MKHKIPTLEELKEQRTALVNVNDSHEESLSATDRAAMFVTDKVGTVGFFSIIFFWTSIWLLWNTFAPEKARFDPEPAFVLWLFISNLIQILLMPLIMIGQTLGGRHAEARAEEQYKINVQTEREVEAILQHLENQSEFLQEIHRLAIIAADAKWPVDEYGLSRLMQNGP